MGKVPARFTKNVSLGGEMNPPADIKSRPKYIGFGKIFWAAILLFALVGVGIAIQAPPLF